jgi:hypothetical protein
MRQAFKVTIIIGYREASRPVSDEEIADHLREVLEPGGWPGVILGTALMVDEFEDPEPVLSKLRSIAKAQGVDL